MALQQSSSHFFALLLDPFCHSADSAASRFESSAAAFCAAASALRALPTTFLLFSPFFPAMAVSGYLHAREDEDQKARHRRLGL